MEILLLKHLGTHQSFENNLNQNGCNINTVQRGKYTIQIYYMFNDSFNSDRKPAICIVNDEDGYLYMRDTAYILIYLREYDIKYKRYLIEHEIGHIIYGHYKKLVTDNLTQEQLIDVQAQCDFEADVYAIHRLGYRYINNFIDYITTDSKDLKSKRFKKISDATVSELNFWYDIKYLGDYSLELDDKLPIDDCKPKDAFDPREVTIIRMSYDCYNNHIFRNRFGAGYFDDKNITIVLTPEVIAMPIFVQEFAAWTIYGNVLKYGVNHKVDVEGTPKYLDVSLGEQERTDEYVFYHIQNHALEAMDYLCLKYPEDEELLHRYYELNKAIGTK